MGMLEEIQSSRKAAARVLAIIILAVLLITAVCSTVTAYAATVDYYELMAGDAEVASFATMEEAQEAIRAFEVFATQDGTVELISYEPVLTIEMRSYKPKTEGAPEICYDVDKLVQRIVNDGSLVTITTEKQETKEVEVPFEKKTEETYDLYEDEEEIKQAGVNGKEKVTEKVTLVNGVETERTEVGREVTLAPVDEITLVGLSSRPVYREPEVVASVPVTGSKSAAVEASDGSAAQAVANYAMQFIGNPYRYGGTSLTSGCDCSGFVYAVYRDMGYSLPRVGFEYSYPSVSTSEMRPGDILVYYGHYALYIGGGMEVEAMNEYRGICTAPVGYHGYYTVCRIIP